MSAPYTGGCLCGRVRYRISAEPIAARVCWCRDCQYLGGGSGTVNAGFPASAIELEGSMSDYISKADSGNVMHRRFCPACGTPLFSDTEARAHLTYVRAGTLDDPESIKPAATIWSGSAPSWASIDPNLPCVAAQPPPAT
jgi:hypothetical protein